LLLRNSLKWGAFVVVVTKLVVLLQSFEEKLRNSTHSLFVCFCFFLASSRRFASRYPLLSQKLRYSTHLLVCLNFFFASSRIFQQGTFYSLGTSDTVPIRLVWFGLVCVSVCLCVFFPCFLGFVFASSRNLHQGIFYFLSVLKVFLERELDSRNWVFNILQKSIKSFCLFVSFWCICEAQSGR
jgi:hypothetical protein